MNISPDPRDQLTVKGKEDGMNLLLEPGARVRFRDPRSGACFTGWLGHRMDGGRWWVNRRGSFSSFFVPVHDIELDWSQGDPRQ